MHVADVRAVLPGLANRYLVPKGSRTTQGGQLGGRARRPVGTPGGSYVQRPVKPDFGSWVGAVKPWKIEPGHGLETDPAGRPIVYYPPPDSRVGIRSELMGCERMQTS